MAFKFGDAVEIKPHEGKVVPWPERQSAKKKMTFLAAGSWTRATFMPYVANLAAQGDVEIKAHIAVAPINQPSPFAKKGE